MPFTRSRAFLPLCQVIAGFGSRQTHKSSARSGLKPMSRSGSAPCDHEEIVVGARSNVQDGSLLHTDMGYPLTIGPDCTIGHHAILHGWTIGENSLIGMGATLLNGAKIGRNCLVGANALCMGGCHFH
jgi:carbonic anhydrase/acetyltransferase-like protein (isoleucine patch superfamily)